MTLENQQLCKLYNQNFNLKYGVPKCLKVLCTNNNYLKCQVKGGRKEELLKVKLLINITITKYAKNWCNNFFLTFLSLYVFYMYSIGLSVSAIFYLFILLEIVSLNGSYNKFLVAMINFSNAHLKTMTILLNLQQKKTNTMLVLAQYSYKQ